MTSMESKNAVLIFGLGNVGGPEHHQPTRVEISPFGPVGIRVLALVWLQTTVSSYSGSFQVTSLS
jgi:hypothetical protein